MFRSLLILMKCWVAFIRPFGQKVYEVKCNILTLCAIAQILNIGPITYDRFFSAGATATATATAIWRIEWNMLFVTYEVKCIIVWAVVIHYNLLQFHGTDMKMMNWEWEKPKEMGRREKEKKQLDQHAYRPKTIIIFIIATAKISEMELANSQTHLHTCKADNNGLFSSEWKIIFDSKWFSVFWTF